MKKIKNQSPAKSDSENRVKVSSNNKVGQWLTRYDEEAENDTDYDYDQNEGRYVRALKPNDDIIDIDDDNYTHKKR